MTLVRSLILIGFALSLGACASRPSLPESIYERGSVSSAGRSSEATDGSAGFWVSNSQTAGNELQNPETRPETRSEARPDRASETDSAVRPGFLLKLTCAGDVKLNGDFRVDKSGNAYLPYKFALKASGRSISDLQAEAAAHYRAFFKRDPQVRLSLAKRQYWVSVQGLVPKPGDILITQNELLDVVLAKAGGADRDARYVQIQRGENKFNLDLQNYAANATGRLPQWFGGEVLTVMKTAGVGTEARETGIQMLGEVRTPGELSFESNSDLYGYLVRAGGPTAQANMNEVQVIRMTADSRRVVTSDAEEIAQHIRLAQGDIVIVGNVRPGKFERTLQVGSTLAAILSAIGIILLVPSR